MAYEGLKVLVVSASMGSNIRNSMVKQSGIDADFINFNNDNFYTRDSSFTPRMAAKLPKMLAWQLMPGYDYYIWMDNTFNIIRDNAVQWYIDNIQGYHALFFKHADRHSISAEARFMQSAYDRGSKHIIHRIAGEPIQAQVEKYLNDPGFNDNLLIAASSFCYSKALISKPCNMMMAWFYEVCTGSIRDQLSLPYILYKFNTNYRLMPDNPFRFEYLKYR